MIIIFFIIIVFFSAKLFVLFSPDQYRTFFNFISGRQWEDIQYGV